MDFLGSFMKFMTDFGDEAVILPLLFVVTVMFYAMGWQRGARVWCAGVATMLGCLILAKLLGLYWGELFGFTGRPFSISGHVVASTTVYGSLFTIALHSGQREWQWVRALLPPLMIAGMIGYTRLQLHAHTQAEILCGTLMGTAGALAVAKALLPVPIMTMRYVLIVPVCVALIFHGYVLPAEPMLQSLFHNSYYWASHTLAW
jgi:membrane-associated phospholipid phosphatase